MVPENLMPPFWPLPIEPLLVVVAKFKPELKNPSSPSTTGLLIVPEFVVEPVTFNSKETGLSVELEPIESDWMVVVADIEVLVEAGITTSSVVVGECPQLQLAARLKLLVPTLANVQVAACAVCGNIMTRLRMAATNPAISQAGKLRIREAVINMAAEVVVCIVQKFNKETRTSYSQVNKIATRFPRNQNPAFQRGFGWLGDLDSNQDTMLQRH